MGFNIGGIGIQHNQLMVLKLFLPKDILHFYNDQGHCKLPQQHQYRDTVSQFPSTTISSTPVLR